MKEMQRPSVSAPVVSKWHYILAPIVVILLYSVQYAFQNQKLFDATIGHVIVNHERIGSWDNSAVFRTRKAFEPLSSQSANWDAAIYKCISQHMYAPDKECYDQVRAAFFPLFPVVWKALGVGEMGVSIFNHIVFSISIFLLLVKFKLYNIYAFSVLTYSPVLLYFVIPYTESLFLFLFTLYVIFQSRNQVLSNSAVALLGMLRPASGVLVMLYSVFTETCNKDSTVYSGGARAAVTIFSWCFGLIIAISIQAYFTGCSSSAEVGLKL